MDLFQALVLGLVQGLIEWLPFSSQGQVIGIALEFFGLSPEQAFSYSIFLHTGTLMAAAAYFRKEIVEVVRLKDKGLFKFLFIALAGTAITAIPTYILLKEFITDTFIFLILIGAMLIVTGALQYISKKERKAKQNSANALLLGLGQGFSILPGISRSGITTSVLLFEGFSVEKAFRLSFILSIPTVLLAEIAFQIFEPIQFEPSLLIAVLVAAIAGFLSMTALLSVARKINFGLFCILFGLLYLAIAII